MTTRILCTNGLTSSSSLYRILSMTYRYSSSIENALVTSNSNLFGDSLEQMSQIFGVGLLLICCHTVLSTWFKHLIWETALSLHIDSNAHTQFTYAAFSTHLSLKKNVLGYPMIARGEADRRFGYPWQSLAWCGVGWMNPTKPSGLHWLLDIQRRIEGCMRGFFWIFTLTRRWRSWSSRVGAMRSGRIWLKRGPAPKSRALSVSWRSALFRWGGVPFFTFRSIFIIFLSFASSTLSSSSSTYTAFIVCWKAVVAPQLSTTILQK